MTDSHSRSLAKGVTWRILASTTTMVIVFIATGNLVLVIGVGVADVLTKILFYYLHERFWGRIHWGRIGTEPFCVPPLVPKEQLPTSVDSQDKSASRDQRA